MRFTTAWEGVIKDNLHLKISTFTLLITTITFVISTGMLALRPPIIIERGCFSKAAIKGEEKQSGIEYEEFIKKSLEQRLNTETKITEGFISVNEKRKKTKEQTALKKNGITQTVLVRGFEFVDNVAIVDYDKIYSVKNLRSTLPSKIKVLLEKKPRTETNPYGLILVKTEEIKEKKEKKDTK